jgi:hypothetical protein
MLIKGLSLRGQLLLTTGSGKVDVVLMTVIPNLIQCGSTRIPVKKYFSLTVQVIMVSIILIESNGVPLVVIQNWMTFRRSDYQLSLIMQQA